MCIHIKTLHIRFIDIGQSCHVCYHLNVIEQCYLQYTIVKLFSQFYKYALHLNRQLHQFVINNFKV
jgi:hypothetical protein